MRLLRCWTFARDELGQSMVEFGLMLPIMVFLVLAGGDMARGFASQIAIQNGARAGAEAAAMDCSAPVVTVSFAHSDASACTSTPTVALPCFATVRVQYTWHTITAWPLIPNTFSFDRSTAMRMIAAP